jgi:DNA polymerase-1
MAKKPKVSKASPTLKKTAKKAVQSKKKYRALLVDADQFIYQVAAACEREIDWGDGIWTLHSDANEGVNSLVKSIANLKAELQADGMIMCLSSPVNFRKKLDDTYKANRKDTRKPLIYWALHKYVVDNYETATMHGLEADDVMAILATKPEADQERVIVSADKDMQCVPAKLYRNGRVEEINADEAHYYHMYQTLVGDRADNYPGCPKVGDVGAKKILDCSTEEMWPRVVEAFVKAGLTKKDALLQARLARILQHGDYNEKTKKVKLWGK